MRFWSISVRVLSSHFVYVDDSFVFPVIVGNFYVGTPVCLELYVTFNLFA